MSPKHLLSASAIVIVVALAGLVSGCQAAPTAAPPTSTYTPTPTTAPPTSTYTPTPTSAPVVGPTTEPVPYVVVLPSDEELVQITTGLEAQAVESMSISAPENRIERVDTICRELKTKGVVVDAPCSFAPERTTTYALPVADDAPQVGGRGVLFQAVALEFPVDNWLNPEAQWDGRGLAIGSFLGYQPSGGQVPAGDFVVVLNRVDDNLTYELRTGSDEVIGGGDWQLRELDAPVEQTYNFLTNKQLCFSQQVYQACLNWQAPGFGEEPNVNEIEVAVNELGDVLPADSQVNYDTAVADVAGAGAIKICSDSLKDTPESCLPDVVVAAVEPVPDDQLKLEQRASARVKGLANPKALQATGAISEAIVGAAVVKFKKDMRDGFVDAKGNKVTLPKGSYRLDLLHSETPTPIWLSRYVDANRREFYSIAVEVRVAGTTVGSESNLTNCDVVLESIIVRVCRRNGEEEKCKNAFCGDSCWKKPICVWQCKKK